MESELTVASEAGQTPDMYDERRFSGLAHTRPWSLLLEDVDALFHKRRPEDENRSGVTFPEFAQRLR